MTHTPRTMSFALVCILCLAPACTEEMLGSLGESTQAANCGQNTCGSNSPILFGHDAAEMNQSLAGAHLANQAGVRLVEFRDPDGIPARYQVEDDGELVILDGGGAVTHSGAAVVGASFVLRHDDSNSDYVLVITDYHQTLSYWIGPAESLPSYTMKYSFVGDVGLRNLCPGPYEHDPRTNSLYPHSLDVLLSTGERYQIGTRNIFDTGAASDGWTNFACVGDGPSKMLLYRHRPDTPENDPYASPLARRQALLRMWAADYCGTGTSFTRHGEPLAWRDHLGMMTEGVTSSVEAIWTPEGVACLDVPRGADWLQDPVTKADVESACSQAFGKTITFPSCAGFGDNDAWPDVNPTFYFKTWNP